MRSCWLGRPSVLGGRAAGYDLGNIGEFVGAIGVVISLAYLAVQIRQNTRQLQQSTDSSRLAAVEAANREFNVVRDQIIRDPEVADLYLRGLRDFGSLEVRDRLRFGLLLQNLFFTFQATFVRYQAHKIGGLGRSQIDPILRHAGAREWWAQAKPGFAPEFVQFIEGHTARIMAGLESAAQQGAAERLSVGRCHRVDDDSV